MFIFKGAATSNVTSVSVWSCNYPHFYNHLQPGWSGLEPPSCCNYPHFVSNLQLRTAAIDTITGCNYHHFVIHLQPISRKSQRVRVFDLERVEKIRASGRRTFRLNVSVLHFSCFARPNTSGGCATRVADYPPDLVGWNHSDLAS